MQRKWTILAVATSLGGALAGLGVILMLDIRSISARKDLRQLIAYDREAIAVVNEATSMMELPADPKEALRVARHHGANNWVVQYLEIRVECQERIERREAELEATRKPVLLGE